MDMQLALIWLHSNAMASKTRRDAFADPLDSPEWDGLIRVLILARMISRWFSKLGLASQIRNRVHRPVEVARNHDVCIS